MTRHFEVCLVLAIAACRETTAPMPKRWLPDGCIPHESAFREPVEHVEHGLAHDGASLLVELRRRDLEQGLNDARLWKLARELCKPCGHWFADDTPVPVKDMVPLELLPRARRVGCFALELEDGSIEYGAYRRRLTSPPRWTPAVRNRRDHRWARGPRPAAPSRMSAESAL